MALHIKIGLKEQTLLLLDGSKVHATFPVSTAKKGGGEQMHSECTPRGRHIIAEKIGAGCASGTVFVGRKATGEIYSAALQRLHPKRDWILTRILWLSGMEPNKNKGDAVDTYRRYIYIHGTPDNTVIGQAGSRGCIRMHSAAIKALFDQVDAGTMVTISQQLK